MDVRVFMDLLGWSKWADKYLDGELGADWGFGDLVFDTLPHVLQLVFIVWLLNWIMGIIADICKTHISGRLKGRF